MHKYYDNKLLFLKPEYLLLSDVFDVCTHILLDDLFRDHMVNKFPVTNPLFWVCVPELRFSQ